MSSDVKIPERFNLMMFHVKKQNKGFTLIELLIVIAIIGILASIVLVSLSSARDKARVAKMASDLKQINNALNLYLATYNTYPCFDHNISDTLPDGHEKDWSAPFLSWPKNPWGGTYHWEIWNNPGFFPADLIFSVSIFGLGQENAEALDKLMDDGNLTTGNIRRILFTSDTDYNRIEYMGMDQTLPPVDVSCT